jgi:hypothetical protein
VHTSDPRDGDGGSTAGLHQLFGARDDPGGALDDGGRKHGVLEPVALPAITLRDFPAFPDQPFSDRVAGSLQGVIDEEVEEFGGISAAVIVGDAGHWSGAAGVDLQGTL